MQFNDTTNLNGLVQSCEFWTGIGRAQISGDTTQLKEFTRLINTNYHKVVTMILDSQDGWDFDDGNHDDTGFIKTYNLTADEQFVKLPLTDEILQVKRAEVTYDGTNWYRAAPMDINEYGNAVSKASNISSDFETTKPFYDLRGIYMYLYPTPAASVTGGLKIWVTREIDEFTTADTTQEPGINEPFHEMIAVGASLDYALAKGLANANNIAAKFTDFEQRLRRFYGSKQEDTAPILKSAYISYE